MRPFASLIVITALAAVAGCQASTPTDPTPAARPGDLRQVRNDTTPPVRSQDAATETASGGIMIGSGTR